MKKFFLTIDIGKLLQLLAPKVQKPVTKHQVKNQPVPLEEQWRRHWLDRTEPADAWIIE